MRQTQLSSNDNLFYPPKKPYMYKTSLTGFKHSTSYKIKNLKIVASSIFTIVPLIYFLILQLKYFPIESNTKWSP